MKSVLAATVALVFFAAAAAQDNDAAIKKEKEQIKGAWKVESVESQEGKQDDANEATLTFAADKLEFKKGNELKKGTFTLNPLGQPKEIDIKADDKEMLGIYKLDKDALTICICPESNQARPSEFAAKNPYLLITLKRVKE